MNEKISIIWFRRDLRLEDNTALIHALNQGIPILPLFIFDPFILSELPQNDARVSFIYETLSQLNQQLMSYSSSFLIEHGEPVEVWKKLISTYNIESVFTNKDYEPYALQRDNIIKQLLKQHQIEFHAFKDQVIFEEGEILKSNGKPYTIFTPYLNRWMQKWNEQKTTPRPLPAMPYFAKGNHHFPSREELGFVETPIKVKPYSLNKLANYAEERDIPSLDSTSYLSPHLRFGTVSIRQVIYRLKPDDSKFLSELVWREFFMQILANFPEVVTENFKPQYNKIEWRNNKEDFQLWCEGKTGYAMVDAGMRQLNATGYMHNRLRMVTASFLCKHLLIDWRWGEAYFAKHLLDYELSSNNGNWQWAAGTGCDAAPYFRVFNPTEQLKKFDPELKYIKKWIPEWGTFDYPNPIVEHTFARNRAIEIYKKALTE